MPEDSKNSGSCLCGSVSFTATSTNSVGACSCSMCRKWNGGPQMAVFCGENVTFEGEENISVFKSSEWADRGFCKNCGTHLFYRLQGTQHMMLAGLFDDQEKFVFETQYFIDNKPDFYNFKESTNNLTAAQVAEMMGLG